MGAAAQPKVPDEVLADRVRRNLAEENLRKLRSSDAELAGDVRAVNGSFQPGDARRSGALTTTGLEARVQAKRQQLAAGLAPDAADLAIKDATTGRVMRRARTGSGRSALGSFDLTKPLGPDSILGGQ